MGFGQHETPVMAANENCKFGSRSGGGGLNDMETKKHSKGYH